MEVGIHPIGKRVPAYRLCQLPTYVPYRTVQYIVEYDRFLFRDCRRGRGGVKGWEVPGPPALQQQHLITYTV